jgi:hypothetical protein
MHNNNVAIGKRTVTNMAVWNVEKVGIGKRTVTNMAVWNAEKDAIGKRTVTNMVVGNIGFFAQIQLGPLEGSSAFLARDPPS